MDRQGWMERLRLRRAGMFYGAGPGSMFYAAGCLEVTHQCGLQCFSGLHVPAGVNWEGLMLRLKGRRCPVSFFHWSCLSGKISSKTMGMTGIF